MHDPISTFVEMKSADKNRRNLFAEMAISRLKEKLAGRYLTFLEMTPQQQITRLLKDARDPENLCKMFAGWMAFL